MTTAGHVEIMTRRQLIMCRCQANLRQTRRVYLAANAFVCNLSSSRDFLTIVGVRRRRAPPVNLCRYLDQKFPPRTLAPEITIEVTLADHISPS